MRPVNGFDLRGRYRCVEPTWVIVEKLYMHIQRVRLRLAKVQATPLNMNEKRDFASFEKLYIYVK